MTCTSKCMKNWVTSGGEEWKNRKYNTFILQRFCVGSFFSTQRKCSFGCSNSTMAVEQWTLFLNFLLPNHIHKICLSKLPHPFVAMRKNLPDNRHTHDPSHVYIIIIHKPSRSNVQRVYVYYINNSSGAVLPLCRPVHSTSLLCIHTH